MSLSLCPSFSLCLSVCLTLCLSFTIFLSVSPSLSLWLYFSLLLCLSVSLSLLHTEDTHTTIFDKENVTRPTYASRILNLLSNNLKKSEILTEMFSPDRCPSCRRILVVSQVNLIHTRVHPLGRVWRHPPRPHRLHHDLTVAAASLGAQLLNLAVWPKCLDKFCNFQESTWGVLIIELRFKT